MKKKRIFISMHYMEIGGAEISLIGLLQAMDYSKYDVDLFIHSHQGELMQFLGDIDATGKNLKQDISEIQGDIEKTLQMVGSKAISDVRTAGLETRESILSIGNEIKEHIQETGEDILEKLDHYL